jgi:hypothetical protein
MRVGQLIFAALGLLACSDGSDGPTGATGGDQSKSDGCAGVDMAYWACFCQAQGLTGSALACCINHDCPTVGAGFAGANTEPIEAEVPEGDSSDAEPPDQGGAEARADVGSSTIDASTE